jgi:hypothetical protein
MSSDIMNTLAEIEAAAAALPPEQKEELLRFLTAQSPFNVPPRQARLIRQGDDALLEAPPGSPPMTPENVKRMLENWP